MVKNLSSDAGDTGDVGLIPGSGKSPGEGNGNPLQHSCLVNPMDRGTLWATVHGSQRDTVEHACTNDIGLLGNTGLVYSC